MVEYHVPKSDKFKNGARREFALLEAEFGFRECESPFQYHNPYSIFCQMKDVFVYVEGLSYGFALGVDIGKIGRFRKIKERFYLGYVVALRRFELLKPRFPEKSGQLEHMKRSASELRRCAEDFLEGEFSKLPSVKIFIEERTRYSRAEFEADELQKLGIKASHAFHSGQYEIAINLLQPVEIKLSKAQKLLLSLSRKRMEI